MFVLQPWMASRTIKSFQGTQKKSEFVLHKFINFSLVIQSDSEKLLEKNRGSIACCYYDSAFRVIEPLTSHMIGRGNGAAVRKLSLSAAFCESLDYLVIFPAFSTSSF